MNRKNKILLLLEEISQCSISNAIELRSASAKVIKCWVNLKLEYPNVIIDRFVYIESSIEDSIINNINDAIALEVECANAYEFHMKRFLQSLNELRDFIESSKVI